MSCGRFKLRALKENRRRCAVKQEGVAARPVRQFQRSSASHAGDVDYNVAKLIEEHGVG
jgi:hypothetical protein